MELVYLWVEEYKNIHKQGFNFSPRFSCDYDGKELTIKENKDYIENFFSENINVTAIVGKNGSGKSAILKVLEDIFYNISLQEDEYILCFISEGKRYILTDIDISRNQDFLNIKKIPTFLLCHYPDINLFYHEEYNYQDKRDYYITFQESKIYEMISNLKKDFELSTFMLTPYKLKVKQNKYKLEQLLSLNGIKPMPDVHREYIKKSGKYIDACDKEREFYVTDNLLEAYLVNRIIRKGYCKELFENSNLPKENQSDSPFQDVFELDKKHIIKILNNKRINEENYQFQEFEYIVNKKEFYLNDLNEKDELLLKKYKEFFIFDYEDNKGCKYSNLSFGEQILYGQLLNIYIFLKKQNTLLITLDEPHNSLHPQWQKKYINEIITLSKKLNKTVHFVITSHSPFLISDIPKQNIIFLDTYKENDKEVKSKKQKIGNCKVLSHDEVLNKKQTFGANIHTLLSDSFFMEDGLIGEFAKGKINEIIDFHKLVEKNRHKDCLTKIYLHSKQKKFWQTQKIIGEEYLKQVIKNHLVEIEKKLLGKDRAKQEEIKRVEAYLESLKK